MHFKGALCPRESKKEGEEMTAIEIIEKHLIDNGFDGLCKDGCACGLGWLVSCESDFSECQPAYRIKCKCEHCECDCEGKDDGQEHCFVGDIPYGAERDKLDVKK